MKRKKREKTPHSRRGSPECTCQVCGRERRVGPDPQERGEERRGRVASGTPPAGLGPRRCGRAWGQDGRGFGSGGGSRGGNGLLDNLPTQHPVMFCLCGKRVQGFKWEECGGEFDDRLKEAEHGKRGAK